MPNGDEQLIRERQMGGDGRLRTPVAEILAASSIVAVATSAHTFAASGSLSVASVAASDQVVLRIVNLQVVNREPNFVLVEFRDGSHVGPRVFGPFTIVGLSDRSFTRDEILGTAVTSGFNMQVVSGGVAQPVSNGVYCRVGFIAERLDIRE